MRRREFLAMLASFPIVGRLVPAIAAEPSAQETIMSLGYHDASGEFVVITEHVSDEEYKAWLRTISQWYPSWRVGR